MRRIMFEKVLAHSDLCKRWVELSLCVPNSEKFHEFHGDARIVCLRPITSNLEKLHI